VQQPGEVGGGQEPGPQRRADLALGGRAGGAGELARRRGIDAQLGRQRDGLVIGD
jgi:hypothetical protein